MKTSLSIEFFHSFPDKRQLQSNDEEVNKKEMNTHIRDDAWKRENLIFRRSLGRFRIILVELGVVDGPC